MQNPINNNERDALSELFRQKLENHRVPVDVNGWDNLQERLKAKDKRRIPFWFWLSGGAAVAAIALLFTLHPFTESIDTLGKAKINTHQQASQNRGSIAGTGQQQPKVNQTNPTAFIQENTTKQITNIPSKEMAQYNPSQDQTAYKDIDSIKTAQNSNFKNETGMAQNSTGNKDTVSKNNRNIPNSLADESIQDKRQKTKDKNSWLLAAAVGSDGNFTSGNGNDGLTVSNTNVAGAPTGYPTKTPVGFSNINYAPPISFGLIIRKNLNKSWSMESGLVYTYLLTTFENAGVQQNNAGLHLHYIGVPLNLIARLWNYPTWEIYVSGGAMAEKGIRSFYVLNQYTGNREYTSTVTSAIDGFQWSVNGGIGATYKLNQHLGIFFEPKISYYFDDKQPVSARTEYPAVIGLTAGVRLQFK